MGRIAWEATKAAIRTRCIAQTKTLRRQEDEETARIKAELSYVEAAIKGAGTHTDASSYTTRDELKKQLTERSRTRRSLNDMLEKEAYENGRKHDVNTAAFHRQWTPKNSAQWVEELVNRDWTDPSNPQNPPPGEADKVTDHSKIAAAFTKYYAPLYANKPIDQHAKAKALKTLRKGNRVLPPTAAKCDADITKEEVLHSSAYLPTGKSPGPDRIPNKSSTRPYQRSPPQSSPTCSTRADATVNSQKACAAASSASSTRRRTAATHATTDPSRSSITTTRSSCASSRSA